MQIGEARDSGVEPLAEQLGDPLAQITAGLGRGRVDVSELLRGPDDAAVLAGDEQPALDLRPQRGGLRQRRSEVVSVRGEQGREEVGLARKMPVERARGETGRAGDVCQPRTRVPALGECVASRR
jgi:hypothetical protein